MECCITVKKGGPGPSCHECRRELSQEEVEHSKQLTTGMLCDECLLDVLAGGDRVVAVFDAKGIPTDYCEEFEDALKKLGLCYGFPGKGKDGRTGNEFTVAPVRQTVTRE